MNRRSLVFSLLLALVLTAQIFETTIGHAQTGSQFVVAFTAPNRDSIKVGKEMDVKGTAAIPSGNHLWILVHRIRGFPNVWWPQGEGEVDPKTKEWEVHVVFGGPQDTGYEFEIAVITVDKQEHLKLQEYLDTSMTTGKWLPIKMPPTTSSPIYRKVLKENHN